ncbi:flavin reductase family protein [Oricola cellulosilytica]|uniref:Flavin reductase family protein n=1 Tax=Oricola cellulosilytica TaxID=1429082 RepID=A0A4R0PBR5_9HYPH|nr:flavin reductase family protein [Oricola cellulosilytica]TCD12377.1 flavin reductase family protein [Oricola cellulosilytica]
MSERFYEPAKGHGLPHNPFKAIVAPRPIGWISTRSASGAINLAPYSFFNAVADNPPVVMFSSTGRKDSVTFAEETGEFVCNYVGEAQRDAMHQSSFAYPRGVSEFSDAGLEEAQCRIVKPPRVAGAPAALECAVTVIMPVKDRGGADTDNWLVFGEVVGVHLSEAALTDGYFDLAKAKPVARLGYLDYGSGFTITAIARPNGPRKA